MTIEIFATALKERPWGSELLVAGDLNADLEQTEGAYWYEDILAALAVVGLEYMLAHFLLQQRPWCWYRRMWSMVWLGREVSSWMEYILGMDHCLFRNVSVWDLRQNSDHYMILGRLCSATLREHTKYLGRHMWIPLWPPTTLMREEGIYRPYRGR